jgi:hypothetical protein
VESGLLKEGLEGMIVTESPGSNASDNRDGLAAGGSSGMSHQGNEVRAEIKGGRDTLEERGIAVARLMR